MSEYDIPRDKDTPWRDPDLLERLYHGEGLTQTEVAEALGVEQSTIYRWMKRHDIKTRDPIETQVADKRLLDEDWLREHYKHQQKTTYDIAEMLGCSPTAVHTAVHRFGIEPHSQAIHKFTIHPTFDTDRSGYERVTSQNYNGSELERTDRISIHRLLAISEYGIDAVKGRHVHHKNGIPWDNRPENIELLTESEHHSHHAKDMWEKGYGIGVPNG